MGVEGGLGFNKSVSNNEVSGTGKERIQTADGSRRVKRLAIGILRCITFSRSCIPRGKGIQYIAFNG